MPETESHLDAPRCPVAHAQPEARPAAQPDAPAADRCPVPTGWRKWIARFGVLGFAFFFIKGMAWLIVPAALAWMAAR
ncbi:MAG: hypothetical protein IBJ10_03335 [Phycisphaerales bacterium]|nr:hypothetical protein [Phycisphaerales bacterium]